MYAFLSYQTADKIVAGRVRMVLERLDISSFLAHEDITVSEEWRLKILEEIRKADIFIPILSRNYYQSCWCVQESGIAAFRKRMLILPLSIDDAIPQGFLGHIQSTKIDPDAPRISEILPGLAKRDVSFVIDKYVEIVGSSGSYRVAEANFANLLPYLPEATDDQIIKLLERAVTNTQVCHASLCATKFLPPIFRSHGHLLDEKVRERLEDVLDQYAD